ncbi:MAG TPA: hypothetical protein VGM90_36900 [Kofleriaceae bacterium]|jgi:hypothetical protein
MSKTLHGVVLSVLSLSVIACASGGQGSPDPGQVDAGNTDHPIDAGSGPGIDATPALDAAVSVDAAPSMTIDAPPGSGLFCSANSECTNAGECCFTFLGASSTGVCTTGDVVFGVCIPPTN